MLRAYGDGTLFGELSGEGPVKVLWLHGWARSGRDFSAAASDLARRGVASVALDLPGFGSSPLPAEAGGASYYAGLVAPILREFGSPVILVGHSFGGRVACELAAEHPELVRTLVLTGVPLVRGPSSRAPRAYRTLRWFHRHGLVGESRMEAARQKYGSTDYRNARGLMRDVLVISVNESYEEALARLRVPVTLLWGELDAEVPLTVATAAAALLQTPPTLRTLPGVGHLVPSDAPAALADVVEALA